MSTKSAAPAGTGGAIAPTSNIALTAAMMDTLLKREPGLPGIGALYGRSGLGKSSAAAYACHPQGINGVYVECRVYDTMKSLVESIAKGLNLQVRGTIASITGSVVDALSQSGRPLVIDEADRLVDTNRVELVRDIHDSSGAAVLLIGEENFYDKLKRHERFDNRVLIWQPAAVCSMVDLDLLAKQYAGGIEIAPELKKRILDETHGVTRRVVTNLANVKRWCEQKGTKKAPADAAIQLYTGAAPGRVAR